MHNRSGYGRSGDSVRGGDRHDGRPERRQETPMIATPKRGPGTDPQYRREPMHERNDDRSMDRSRDQPREQPRERFGERQQERTMERRYPPPTPPLRPVEPMHTPRMAEPQREDRSIRNNDFDRGRRDTPQRDMRMDEPRATPRGFDMRGPSPREDRGGGGMGHVRRPGDRF